MPRTRIMDDAHDYVAVIAQPPSKMVFGDDNREVIS